MSKESASTGVQHGQDLHGDARSGWIGICWEHLISRFFGKSPPLTQLSELESWMIFLSIVSVTLEVIYPKLSWISFCHKSWRWKIILFGKRPKCWMDPFSTWVPADLHPLDLAFASLPSETVLPSVSGKTSGVNLLKGLESSNWMQTKKQNVHNP